jgi:hypothetical protein
MTMDMDVNSDTDMDIGIQTRAWPFKAVDVGYIGKTLNPMSNIMTVSHLLRPKSKVPV